MDFLTLLPSVYHSLLLVGPSNGIHCLHRADEVFAAQLKLVSPCVEPMREPSLWVDLYFYSSAQHVLFILLWWFVRWEASVYTATVLCILLPGFFQNGMQHPHIVHLSKHFDKVQVVQLYNSTDTATALKNSWFILSERLDFLMVNKLSIVVHLFFIHVDITFSRWDIAAKVCEILEACYLMCKWLHHV